MRNGSWKAPIFPANPNQKPSPGWTFFNPNCDKNTNVYQCVHNAAPTTRCLLGTDPRTCQPYNAPMQITRMNPVNATANGVTAWFWSLMPKDSVFNYYRLVNVQWPQTPGNPQTPGEKVPLGRGNPMPAGSPDGKAPPSSIVANTTMESFQQSNAACMDCHVYASIATPKLLRPAANGLRKLDARSAPQFASDYSFIFSTETRR